MPDSSIFTKAIVISCLFISFLTFGQKNERTSDIDEMPVSIYSSTVQSGQLTSKEFITYIPGNYSFLLVDNNLNFEPVILNVNLKNFSRIVSFEDLTDNYKKAELNKHFFKGYNMWDIRLQKETQKQLQ